MNVASILGRTIPNFLADHYGALNGAYLKTSCSVGVYKPIFDSYDSICPHNGNANLCDAGSYGRCRSDAVWNLLRLFFGRLYVTALRCPHHYINAHSISDRHISRDTSSKPFLYTTRSIRSWVNEALNLTDWNYLTPSMSLRKRIGVLSFSLGFALLTGNPIAGALLTEKHHWVRPLVFAAVSHPAFQKSIYV